MSRGKTKTDLYLLNIVIGLYFKGDVSTSQLSVLNGDNGSPSLLKIFPTAVLLNA
jgi:hypothetical protein